MSQGTVKFFNSAKGFGFIAPEGGGADVFVHVSALQHAGLASLDEGDVVSFEVEQDRRSGRASAVEIEIVQKGEGRPGGFSPRPSRDHGSRDFSARPARQAVVGEGSGEVKWYNPDKGFGFIRPADGGEDVFVHASALRRAGLNTLADGQAISFDLERDPRSGKVSAANLRLS
jgi:cold shock protein